MATPSDREMDAMLAKILSADAAAGREFLRRLQYGKLSSVERRMAVLAGLYADEGGGRFSLTAAGSAFLREQGARLDRLDQVAADGEGA